MRPLDAKDAQAQAAPHGEGGQGQEQGEGGPPQQQAA
jgi:hypothetical protein